jgi:hypothetical protein
MRLREANYEILSGSANLTLPALPDYSVPAEWVESPARDARPEHTAAAKLPFANY